MSPAEQTASLESNHPLALRMATIAFINQNITIACIWGSFSVLLGAVETRLGVGRELSTLAVPVVNLATAVCAPIAGVLATRQSLRLIMLVGAILSAAGFAMLALTSSYLLYLIAFGLLLGPGMAVGAGVQGHTNRLLVVDDRTGINNRDQVISNSQDATDATTERRTWIRPPPRPSWPDDHAGRVGLPPPCPGNPG